MAEDANAQIRIDIDTTSALASIKNLQRQISVFHQQMQASGNAANAALSQNLQKNLVNSINATKAFSANLTNIKSTTESFTNSLEKNKFSMGEYFRYAGASTKTFGRLFASEFQTIDKVARERVKTLQTQYIKMGRDANGALQAIQVRPLTLDMQNLGTQTAMAAQKQQIFNQLIKQGSTNLLNWGKNTQWAGRQLMVGFTIPLAMMGTVAAKSFMDLEKQAIRFKRVYGEVFTTTEQTNKALQEIKNLANEFTKYGVAVEKTMELAADAAAMGQMGADLTAQVAEATRLAVLGGVEQQEALKTTISLTSAFGVATEDLARKTDFLNAVENQTVVSIEDLTIAIPKAGPVVKQLGGDVEDLAFFLTAMKEGGINASEGANALKSGLASLINPAQKTKDMLQGLGINIDSIVEGNAGNVKNTVIGFANALDTLDPLNRARAIEQLFGKFQFSRISTLFQNVVGEGTQASRVLELSKATAEELAVLSERELKRVEDSPLFKFQKAVEDMQVSLAPLGEQFIKLVTPLIDFGTSLLKQFNNMSEGGKTFVTGLIAVLGLVAPAALMTIGLVANGVANLIKGFNAVRLFYQRLSGSSTELGNTTQYMTQEQLEAAAVASSLGQTHAQLAQIFTSEAQAIQGLIAAYRQATVAANALNSVAAVARVRPPTVVTTNAMGGKRAVSPAGPPGFAKGILSVPGPKGAGDIVAAMLSPGEAVIPAKQTEKYAALIQGIVSDTIPGYRVSNIRNVKSRADLDLRAKSSFDTIGSYEPRRSRSAKTSSDIIDQVVPGGGEELLAILAEGDVSKQVALRLMSQGADVAKTAEAYNEYLETVKKSMEATEKDNNDFVANSKNLRLEISERTGYKSKSTPKGDNVFAHAGSGAEVTAQQVKEMFESGQLNLQAKTQKRLEEIFSENPDAPLSLKSGFGITGITQKTNAQLAGAGADIKTFAAETTASGVEKWSQAIKNGGGDVEELSTQAEILDREFQKLISSVQEGTLVFDTESQVRESEAKGKKAVSLEGLASTARTNVKSQIPELDRTLTNAQSNAIQVRGFGKNSSIDTTGLNTISNNPIAKLQEQAVKENKIYLSELSTASDKAAKDISEQTAANSKLSSTTDVATQNANKLATATALFGQKAGAVSSQINSVGPRRVIATQGAPRVFANKGLLSVPGPKGAGDVVPAMLSPGEAVIPAKMAQRYAPFIQDMISGNIPGFMRGVFLGMPKSSKAVSKNRSAADQIYELFKKSSYVNTPPTAYGHQISPTSGHSFPIFGLGGVYQKGTSQVFVKPVMDEKAALAEMRATTIARQAHGLKSPTQRIVVIRDPMDVKRQRRFLALESDLDPTFINDKPMGVFNEEQYFRQLVASLLRVDKDLSAANVYGDVVADVGPAGVFDRASGLRDYSKNLPSMEEQALINLLGIKGGAKRAFAESTLGLMAGLTPQQYKQRMLGEIQRVLPKLKQTIASFKLTDPTEVGMYDDMVRRLEAGLAVDWSKFHTLHSNVTIAKPKKPKTVEPVGYKRGVVSVPGPKGAGDVVPAMLSPGEAVIPTKMAKKYAPLISSMISNNIPGYFEGYDPNKDPFRTPSFDPNPFGGESSEVPVVPDKKSFKDVAKVIGKNIASEAQLATKEAAQKFGKGVRLASARATGKLFGNPIEGKDGEILYDPTKDPASRHFRGSAGSDVSDSIDPANIARDKDGNPILDANGKMITQDAVKQAKKERSYQTTARIGQGLMGLTMVAGMATQAPGQIGQIAQQAIGPLAAVSTAMSILPGKFGIIAGVLAGLGVVLFSFREALIKSRNEARASALAMSSGSKAMENFADFTGKTTATSVMNKVREQARAPFEIVTGKNTFGGKFIESEQGKGLLAEAEKAKIMGGADSAAQQIGLQLSQGIASNLLTKDQAFSIANNLGEAMGDYSFAVDVNAQMIQLLGPNGEDLSKNPLEVKVKLIEAKASTLEVKGGAKDLMSGTTGSFWEDEDGIFGIGGTANRTNAKEVAAAEAEYARTYSDIIEMGRENVNQLELEHRKKLDILKASGDQKAIDEAESKFLQDKDKLIKSNAAAIKKEADYLDGLQARGGIYYQSARQVVDNLEQNLKDEFEGFDQATKDAVNLAIENVANNPNLKFSEKATIVASMTVENMDLFRQIQATFPVDKNIGLWKRIAQISVTMGPGTSEQLLSLLPNFTDESKAKKFTKFVVNLQTKGKLKEAQSALDTMEALGKIRDIKGDPIDLSQFVNDDGSVTEKFINLQNRIQAINTLFDQSKGKSLVYDASFTSNGFNLTAAEIAWFNKLPADQQKIFTTAYLTVKDSIDASTPEGRARINAWKQAQGFGADRMASITDEEAISGIAEDEGFKVVRESQAIGKNIVDDEKKDTTGGGQKVIKWFEELLKKLKNTRDSAINAAGGLKELRRVLGGIRTIKIFDGVGQKLSMAGISEGFADELMEMGKKARKKFVKIGKDGKAELTALGKLREKANNATTLGAYNLQQVRALQSTKNQSVALNKLVGAGLSVADAYDAISDSSLAAAVASSKLKGEELRRFVADTKAALAATKSFSAELGALQKIEERNDEIRAKNALQKSTFTFSQQQAILSDKELTDMFLSGNTGTNFKSRLAQILTPEFLQGLFEEGMNKALEAISVKERKIELDFEASTRSLTNLKDGVITLAQRQIASIEYLIDDYDAELKDISDQEEKINEEYDKREKSLDKVRSLNNRIASQQKTQMTIAQALSSGDIAAAARATQELRAQQAADAIEQQKENLALAREAQLGKLRSKNGKSRSELEAQIKDLENQIFKIQEERLEPAQRTLELATDTRDIAISNVEYLGRNRDAWTSVALEIDSAKISSDNYGTSITAAIALVDNLKTAWKNVGTESVAATGSVSVPATGSTGSSGASGQTGLIPGDTLFNKMADMYKALSDGAKQNFQEIVDLAPGSGFSNWIAKRKSGAISDKNLSYAIDSILVNGKVGDEEVKNKDGNISFNKNLGGRIQKFAVGNIVPGIGNTDKVPGLLTPGEFVVRKSATKAYLPQLKAMNSGLFPSLNAPSYGLSSPNLSLAQRSADKPGQTMYNNSYSIDVNVSTDANPNEIARAVMTQIKQIDSQRIRGNRF